MARGGGLPHLAPVEPDRVEFLRRRIVLYRRYMHEGVMSELAREYLHQIAEDTAELDRAEAPDSP
jgi:hypothetical protein